MGIERVVYFYVPTKAGERPGNEAQDAQRYGYRERLATKWPGLFPAFPEGWALRLVLAALQAAVKA
jgi:hypothetical protein